jgi:hypothetical protein
MPSESEFLSPERLRAIGEINAVLLRRGGFWIHRRKETISIIDETAVRREVSVDFTLPDSIDGVSHGPHVKHPEHGEPVYCPPLFVLPKAPSNLMAFDLTNEAGTSLPLMTRRDNARVSGETIVALARLVLADEAVKLNANLEGRLRSVAEADLPQSLSLVRLGRDDSSDADASQLELLRQDGAFMWWLGTVSHSSVVVVPYRDPTVRRKIFRLSYQQPMSYTLSVTGRLGWTAYKVVVDSSWIDARSFHLEAEAPPGLRIAGATLTDDEAEPVSTRGVLRRVHLYRPGAERAGAGTATLALRVGGPGFIGGALLASALVTAAVVGCLFDARNIASNPTSAPALLLLLPAAIASYVARPDLHALTTRLLSFARWLILLAGGVAYGCAAFVALGGSAKAGAALTHRAHVLCVVFAIGTGIAGLAVVMLGFGWLLTIPRIRNVLRLRWLRTAGQAIRKSRFRQVVSVPCSRHAAFAATEAALDTTLRLEEGRSKRDTRDVEACRLVYFRFVRGATWRLEVVVDEHAEVSSVTITGDCVARPLGRVATVWRVRRESAWVGRRLRDLAETLGVPAAPNSQ